MQPRPWAFIDYENIGKLTDLDLSPYAYVILFLGAKQNRLDFAEVAEQEPTYIMFRMREISPNNLDMHLSFNLGRFDAKPNKHIRFDVISNDKGFAPLVKTISEKRPCRLLNREAVLAKKAAASKSVTTKALASKPVVATPIATKLTAQQLTQLEQFVTRLQSPNSKNRPKTRQALCNHLRSHFKNQPNQPIEALLQQLLTNKVISLQGDKVHYHKLG